MTEREQPIPRKAVQQADGLSDSVQWLLEQYSAILDRYHPPRERPREDAA